jgi:hypothetical protein
LFAVPEQEAGKLKKKGKEKKAAALFMPCRVK